MDRRFTLFAILVAAIFVANQIVYSLFFAPPPVAEGDAKKVAQAKADAEKAERRQSRRRKAAQPDAAADKAKDGGEEPRIDAAPEAPAADAGSRGGNAGDRPQWITLGSADPRQIRTACWSR